MTEEAMNEVQDLLQKYADVKPEEVQIRLNEKVQELSRELIAKRAEADKMKEDLTTLNKRINELQYTLLPDLFNQLRITSYATDEGVELEQSPEYRASLPVSMDPTKRQQAFQWLKDHAPEIVKQEFVLSYDGSEHEVAETTLAILKEFDINPEVRENVHHSTLTSWVKNQFLAGEPVPFELLNAKIGTKVQITRGKEEEAKQIARIREANKESSSE